MTWRKSSIVALAAITFMILGAFLNSQPIIQGGIIGFLFACFMFFKEKKKEKR